MEMNIIKQLSEDETLLIEGGSWFSDAICWCAGVGFATPGYMASKGVAAHAIMAFK